MWQVVETASCFCHLLKEFMCGKQKNRLTNSHSVSLSPSSSSVFRTGTAQKFQPKPCAIPKPFPFGVSVAGVFKGEDDHGAATAADLLWVRILEPRLRELTGTLPPNSKCKTHGICWARNITICWGNSTLPKSGCLVFLTHTYSMYKLCF